jgi:hypothetical protein
MRVPCPANLILLYLITLNKILKIFWPTERLAASHEGLFSVALQWNLNIPSVIIERIRIYCVFGNVSKYNYMSFTS